MNSITSTSRCGTHARPTIPARPSLVRSIDFRIAFAMLLALLLIAGCDSSTPARSSVTKSASETPATGKPQIVSVDGKVTIHVPEMTERLNLY